MVRSETENLLIKDGPPGPLLFILLVLYTTLFLIVFLHLSTSQEDRELLSKKVKIKSQTLSSPELRSTKVIVLRENRSPVPTLEPSVPLYSPCFSKTRKPYCVKQEFIDSQVKTVLKYTEIPKKLEVRVSEKSYNKISHKTFTKN